jgi:hypothetical protein
VVVVQLQVLLVERWLVEQLQGHTEPLSVQA